MAPAPVDLTVEKSLVAAGESIIGIDEVGRGALAGPVCVAAVLIRPHEALSAPLGLSDSKLLSPNARAALMPQIHDWADGVGLGFASASEVDAVGVNGALQRAAERALSGLPRALVLLDGSYDWLSRHPVLLDLTTDSIRPDPMPHHHEQFSAAGAVVTQVKADLTCASVAAASIIAKVSRDALMGDLALRYPQFDWAGNKGYASPSHRAAIIEHGATPEHRLSWNLIPATPPA